jgi:hypothetical protein
VAGAEFEVVADSPEVQTFVEEHCKRFWERGVPVLQGGYEYGWSGAEAVYADDESGMLSWDRLLPFNPRDVFLLTRASRPVGVRVQNVKERPVVDLPNVNAASGLPPAQGFVDLWTASADVPAKGVWYAHNPRYSQYYGQSQLLGAWRPWRRLAWRDGAEQVIDGGVFRFAYAGPQVRYPEEDFQAANVGAPATTLDSQGRPRRYARDVARQLAEWIKTGAGVGIPSNAYPPELGGGPKWDVKWPEGVLDVDPLINYARWLEGQIKYGVGVPPELLEASETGSGYSGRVIPLEGFLQGQQRIADALLLLFCEQVLRPLVRWNFGIVKWQVKVLPLLQSKQKNAAGKNAQPPGSTTPNEQAGTQPADLGQSAPPPAFGPSPAQAAAGNAPSGILSMNDQALVTDRVRELARKILRAA